LTPNPNGKVENRSYYVTVERIVKTNLTQAEAKLIIINYKKEGLLHMRNDGITGLRP